MTKTIYILSHRYSDDINNIFSLRYDNNNEFKFVHVPTFDYQLSVERLAKTNDELNLVIFANFSTPNEMINTQFFINKHENINCILFTFDDFVVEKKYKRIKYIELPKEKMFKVAFDKVKETFGGNLNG